MKRKVIKKAKIAICRQCHGTGILKEQTENGIAIMSKCPQCGGSGRVIVSATMECDIQPYIQNI